jgi:hypothetical protein
MVTTTSPVAGVVNEPVPRAIIVRSVCRSPFAVSNSRALWIVCYSGCRRTWPAGTGRELS